MRTLRWGDIATLRYGKGLREYPSSRSESHSFRVFGTNGPIGWHSKPLVNAPGIIVGRKGAYRGVHFSSAPFYVIDTAYYLDITDPNVDLKWAYYNLLTVDINRMDSGSAIPSTSRSDFDAIVVQVPEKSVQQRITQILSAYDDLIENNRRRMELLEASARHLYEEWFIRLCFPGHEHTKIVNGVPEGWEISPLEDVAEFRLGKMLDQIKNKGEERPYLANVNVRWGQIDLNDLREMRFEEHEMDAFGLKYGDIVMCEGGEPGRCAIWKDQLPGMMIQKAIHRIRARAGVDYAYLYYCLRHLGLSGQLATLFTGATIKHLPREKLAKVSVMIPNTGLAELFKEQVHPIERQIALLQSSSRKASEARDLLLPRLMSGEVAI